jgi:Protein of unknown function (DUF1761)
MTTNWLALGGIIVAQYIIGALWYSLIFGKQWIQINHPKGLPSKEEIARLEKEATPYYIIQFVLTCITAWVQWKFIMNDQDNWVSISLLIWAGFLVPSIIQTVMWSDPQNKKKLLQVGIMALHFLVTVLLAGYVFATFG